MAIPYQISKRIKKIVPIIKKLKLEIYTGIGIAAIWGLTAWNNHRITKDDSYASVVIAGPEWFNDAHNNNQENLRDTYNWFAYHLNELTADQIFDDMDAFIAIQSTKQALKIDWNKKIKNKENDAINNPILFNAKAIGKAIDENLKMLTADTATYITFLQKFHKIDKDGKVNILKLSSESLSKFRKDYQIMVEGKTSLLNKKGTNKKYPLKGGKEILAQLKK